MRKKVKVWLDPDIDRTLKIDRDISNDSKFIVSFYTEEIKGMKTNFLKIESAAKEFAEMTIEVAGVKIPPDVDMLKFDKIDPICEVHLKIYPNE